MKDEKFTINHDGEKLSFSEGFEEDVDFVALLKEENISNMVSHAKDGVYQEKSLGEY